MQTPFHPTIMIVGDAPSHSAQLNGHPFGDSPGDELILMLTEAGINPNRCHFTHVWPEPIPGNKIDKLFLTKAQAKKADLNECLGCYPSLELGRKVCVLSARIKEVNPSMIIALGNLALWALTGEGLGKKATVPSGIGKWRGSMLNTHTIHHGPARRVIPTYAPASILKVWSWRAIAVQDLKRAANGIAPSPWAEPKWNFKVRPSFLSALNQLLILYNWVDHSPDPVPLAVDLETRSGHVACVGIAWSPVDAFCLPIMCTDRPAGYWNKADEIELLHYLRRLLEHPNARIIGQNFLFDLQYHVRRQFIAPEVHQDTLVMQHLLFPGTPKSLDHLSSMYCTYHRYWKDDGKHWDASMDEDQLWVYNCRDACATWEIAPVLWRMIQDDGLTEQHTFLMRLYKATFAMMLRGIRIDRKTRTKFTNDVMRMRGEVIDKLLALIPEPYIGVAKPTKNTAFWYNSDTQIRHLLYTEMKIKPVLHRKTKRPTADDEALKKIEGKYPLLKPLLSNIRFLRSLGVFYNNFLTAKLSEDGRMRCSFNLAGTETFRFSSSEDAFGSGTNLQNIPNAERTVADPMLSKLPDIRRMFIPDPGMTITEWDLDRADAQVVAWEAGDEKLKQVFREGVDVHSQNAKDIWGDHVDLKRYRPLAKAGVHAANYDVRARTLASTLGITVHEADGFLRKWFAAHPEIKQWHERIERQLIETRTVHNAFGFRRIYFDRIDGLLKEALAWIGQSTTAIVIDEGLVTIHETMPEVQILLQVHDSLVMQFPSRLEDTLYKPLNDALNVTVAYDDPLIIPVSGKFSRQSWGSCEAWTA